MKVKIIKCSNRFIQPFIGEVVDVVTQGPAGIIAVYINEELNRIILYDDEYKVIEE